MSKFSVKKPLTIFVAVIGIIVLGVVAFLRMTPDLLPSINLPYAIVVTAYPGATPEEVELVVTKPVEQALATLDNIKSISSTSNESYSMVIMEFEESANMDSLTADMREKLSTVEGAWSDSVATPTIMKINPNMLPVTVTAVSFAGKNATELTAYLKDTLQNKLEGTAGVAGIDVTGGIEESISVTLSKKKIEALNKKLTKAIDDQFADAQKQMDDAKKQITDAQKQLEATKETLADSLNQIKNGYGELETQMAAAETQISDQKLQLAQTRVTLTTQRDGLVEKKAELEQLAQLLKTLQTAQNDLTAEAAHIQNTITELEALYEEYQSLQAQSEEYVALQARLNTVREELIARGMENESIAKAVGILQDEYARITEKIDAGKTSVEQMVGEAQSIDEYLQTMEEGKKAIDDGIAAIDSALEQMSTGDEQMNAALAEMSKQKAGASMDLYAALSGVLIGQNTVEQTGTQLAQSLQQLEDSGKTVDEQRQAAYKAADISSMLTISTLSQLLTAQNFSMPAGYIAEDGENWLIRVGDKIAGVEELTVLPLLDTGMEEVGVVHLQDIADVELLSNAGSTYAKINGEDGIILSFTKQATYSTAEVSNNLGKRMKQLEKDNPGLHFTMLMDQGDYIYMIVDMVYNNLIIGAVLAILVLLFFLKDIRPTFIIACSIPLSVVFAIVLMYFSGVTLNMLSLSGLAVGVGMLVDNSVVVIENIYRLRMGGTSAAKAAVYGAKQVAGSIISSTLTTVCVFLPIVFVEGLTRQLFTDMALTITYSLMASLLVALTLVPAMSGTMLQRVRNKRSKSGTKVMAGYTRLLGWGLDHKPVFLLIPLVLLVGSFVLIVLRGFIFMPSMSSTQVSGTITFPAETTFAEQTEMADTISARVQELDDVETVGTMFGSGSALSMFSGGMGGGSKDGASATMYIILKENAKQNSMEIADDILATAENVNCTLEVAGSMDLSSYMSAMSGSGVGVRIYGEDLTTLQQTARDLGDTMAGVPGIAEVDNGVGEVTPELHIAVDKEKAAKNGLTVAQVFAALYERMSTSTSGGTVQQDTRNLDVTIYGTQTEEMDLRDIYRMTLDVTLRDGTKKAVLLQSVADITETTAMSSISRSEQRRYITVTGTVKEGENITLATGAVKKALDAYTLPEGVTLEYAGENEAIMDALEQLMLMLLLAVILIYLIMVAQFQSLLSPFIVMFTIPLVFTGGFLALLICGYNISVISLIGFIMLSGIIVNNGIVLVDYINQLRLGGMPRRQAILEAGVTRMRPILMTAVTTILGLFDMALGRGMGAELMQPIAVVCIGGLLYATLMTVFVVPVMYDLLSRRELKNVDVEIDDTIVDEAQTVAQQKTEE